MSATPTAIMRHPNGLDGYVIRHKYSFDPMQPMNRGTEALCLGSNVLLEHIDGVIACKAEQNP